MMCSIRAYNWFRIIAINVNLLLFCASLKVANFNPIILIPPQTLQLTMIPSNNYEFPNGYNALFGTERFKIPEPLFDPTGTNLRILGNRITQVVLVCGNKELS